MSQSLFSNSWYRVADFKPRLRTHTDIHRHVFRGKAWYVLQDHQTGRFHRLSSIANLMVCLMDGRRSMRDIWESVGQKSKDDPPTQDEAIHLLAQLHSADLLQGEIPPDFAEMANRSETAARTRLMQKLRNPLSLRVPLFDPDRILELTLPLARPIFSVWGFLAWLTLVLTGVVVAALHWPEISADVADRVLATENVAVLMCVYPIIKSLHELGHAYATKVWGGEVHEIGVMLLVFIPVLYVDASSSAAFRQKRRRMIVGAAGMLVEMALAAIAMIVWTQGSPGLGRTVAYNVVLIGGVSTLFFNGNPLLRFDGYYILSDLLEIPNLGSRSNAYFFHLIQTYILGLPEHQSPVTAPGEEKWLFAYAVLSFCYRLLVSFGIALFLASTMFAVGLVMAVWALGSIAIMPAFKGLKFLFTSPQLRGRRQRAFVAVGAIAAVALGIVFAIPLPYATVAEGVITVPDQAEVRAKTDGFVVKALAEPGSDTVARQPLVELEDPTLDARIASAEAQLDESRQRLDAVRDIDRVQAAMFEEQGKHLADRLDAFRERKRDLVITTDQEGRFVMPNADSMPGRWVKRGELIGYVIPRNNAVVRVLVPQSEVDLVRQRTLGVKANLVEDLEHPLAAHILREVPSAQQDVPSLALTTRGGGTIALDPTRTQRALALFSLFQFDIQIDEPLQARTQGARVYVRFLHGGEPIAWRMLRSLRQFFLGQFRV